MKESINERIRLILQHFNYSKADLAKIAGVSGEAVRQWAENISDPKDAVLVKIIRNHDQINARWLITGEGEMLDGIKADMVEEPKVDYGKDLQDRLEAKSEEIGALKYENAQLKQRIVELEVLVTGGHNQGSGGSGARAG